ncbi:MAG: hypothetical protein C0391_08355 [Anaerolinea sp.]|nr:hypothetical protein [Anaerolinea sp.]
MKRSLWIIVTVVVCLCCCVTLITAGYTVYMSFGSWGASSPRSSFAIPTVETSPARSTAAPASKWKVAPDLNPAEMDLAHQMLFELENTEVPINNVMDLVGRFEGKFNIPLTLPAPVEPLEPGARQDFWVSNSDDNRTFQLTATLQYITDHAYLWVEEGVSFNKKDLARLANSFEESIYPTTRNFFGEEWSPGVDNDPHIYILLGSNIGNYMAGYFATSDEYNPLAHEYSNAHEMFILNADRLRLDSQFTYAVLAHEFQHMIQWYQDLNEETWLNEGFSELAALINGYDPGGFDYIYTNDTDLQLTDWEGDVGLNGGHYGASFLFVTYLMDRFGEEFAQALVSHPANGLEGIDQLLVDFGFYDPISGSQITADDVFADWAVTNYLDDKSVMDGRYAYASHKVLITANATVNAGICTHFSERSTVSQYGVDYIQFECEGDQTIRFEGRREVPLLPEQPYSGMYAFWSFRGDESDMTLTREFNLTGVTGDVFMSYQTWYDLEEDYDYAYVEASLDGRNWDILFTSSGTDKDLTGNSYGWGYNGQSGGWITEEVDLSAYAGNVVQLRFEYITDSAVNGEGLLVDDISIPAIDYFEDFETGSGGWDAAGFVRIANRLPQRYKVSVITFGDDVLVTPVTLDAMNRADIRVDFSADIHKAVLVISGTTRFTTQPAEYLVEIQ